MLVGDNEIILLWLYQHCHVLFDKKNMQNNKSNYFKNFNSFLIITSKKILWHHQHKLITLRCLSSTKFETIEYCDTYSMLLSISHTGIPSNSYPFRTPSKIINKQRIQCLIIANMRCQNCFPNVVFVTNIVMLLSAPVSITSLLLSLFL